MNRKALLNAGIMTMVVLAALLAMAVTGIPAKLNSLGLPINP